MDYTLNQHVIASTVRLDDVILAQLRKNTIMKGAFINMYTSTELTDSLSVLCNIMDRYRMRNAVNSLFNLIPICLLSCVKILSKLQLTYILFIRVFL